MKISPSLLALLFVQGSRSLCKILQSWKVQSSWCSEIDQLNNCQLNFALILQLRCTSQHSGFPIRKTRAEDEVDRRRCPWRADEAWPRSMPGFEMMTGTAQREPELEERGTRTKLMLVSHYTQQSPGYMSFSACVMHALRKWWEPEGRESFKIRQRYHTSSEDFQPLQRGGL